MINEFQRYIEIMEFPLLSKYGRSINECLFYYFNEEQKFSLKEQNGELFISVIKQKKELERLPLQKPEDIEHQIHQYFQKVRQKNKLKHLLSEEKYFLKEFFRSLKLPHIDGALDQFYSLLQGTYSSIEIEELADLYVKREKVNKKALYGGYVLFQFADKVYLLDTDSQYTKEIQEDEIEKMLIEEYTNKIKEAFRHGPFQKEKI
jgi:hypothetical protein